jgi:hypothetical protein
MTRCASLSFCPLSLIIACASPLELDRSRTRARPETAVLTTRTRLVPTTGEMGAWQHAGRARAAGAFVLAYFCAMMCVRYYLRGPVGERGAAMRVRGEGAANGRIAQACMTPCGAATWPC